MVAVYPREEAILGRPVYRRVQDVPGEVDIVDVFRRSEQLGAVTSDALAGHAKALWFQLDCIDEESAERARRAGVAVVMDRCIMVDHARLLGKSA